MNCDGAMAGSINRKWKARRPKSRHSFGATSHPASASSNSAECSHIPRIDERYENGEGEGEDRLISFRSERRARRPRPFDVNLKPRHKHVSRVGGGDGGKADRGWKRREDGACDAESDFGS